MKRFDRTSRFGKFYYEPIDIKAGHGWEERKFKEKYAFQVMFYWMMLQQIQGVVLEIGRIINVEKEIEEFVISDFTKSHTLLSSESSGDGKTIKVSFDVVMKEEMKQNELISKISKIGGVSEVVIIAAKSDVDY